MKANLRFILSLIGILVFMGSLFGGIYNYLGFDKNKNNDSSIEIDTEYILNKTLEFTNNFGKVRPNQVTNPVFDSLNDDLNEDFNVKFDNNSKIDNFESENGKNNFSEIQHKNEIAMSPNETEILIDDEGYTTTKYEQDDEINYDETELDNSTVDEEYTTTKYIEGTTMSAYKTYLNNSTVNEEYNTNKYEEETTVNPAILGLDNNYEKNDYIGIKNDNSTTDDVFNNVSFEEYNTKADNDNYKNLTDANYGDNSINNIEYGKERKYYIEEVNENDSFNNSNIGDIKYSDDKNITEDASKVEKFDNENTFLLVDKQYDKEIIENLDEIGSGFGDALENMLKNKSSIIWSNNFR